MVAHSTIEGFPYRVIGTSRPPKGKKRCTLKEKRRARSASFQPDSVLLYVFSVRLVGEYINSLFEIYI